MAWRMRSRWRKGGIYNHTLYTLVSNTELRINDHDHQAYMYIQRHPARPLEPLSPAWTAAMRNPENRGPTEVKTWINVLRRASSWGL